MYMSVLSVALPSASGVGTAALSLVLRPVGTPSRPDGASAGLVLRPASAGLVLLAFLLLGSGWILSLRRKLVRQAEELATVSRALNDQNAALGGAQQRVEKLEKLVTRQEAVVLQAAHELRSPTASIYNTLDVLLQGYGGGAPPEQVEILSLVRDRAGAMLGMLNDCLSLGAIRHAKQAKEVLPVQLTDLLSRMLPEMRIKATLKGIDLTLEVADSLPPVGATEEHIAQLLSNLIDNAIKYTDPGGKVVVALRGDQHSVVGTVRDTGIGIAAQDMPRIFKKFFRAENAKQVEPYGSGLGLPIVQRVVKLYGGDIEVQSQLGEGTSFTFTLPVFKPAAGPEAEASIGQTAEWPDSERPLPSAVNPWWRPRVRT